jgi:LacI family transcriptional regulator
MPKRRYRVGLAIDAAMSYGRGIMRGVMRYANVRRQWVLHEEFHATSSLQEWPQCDGAILTATAPAVLEMVRRHTEKIIACSETADPAQTCVVCVDGEAIGRMAALHLIDCHLKHFAYYGPAFRSARAKSFNATLAERGFACAVAPVEHVWISRPHWIERPHWPALIEWLTQLPKPVGIMAWDDMAARDLAAACLYAEIFVPDQVSIIGVNNDDLLCDSAWPPLTSVDVDFSEVGYRAAQQLDRLLTGEKIPTAERLVRVAPLGVVQRLSTNMLALDDPELARAVAFIRERACDPCGVPEVLRHVAVSRRWLERQFLDVLGRTIHDEIMRVRMEMAQRLLHESDETLQQIAERCGFAAVQSFGLAFRKKLGVTPAAYRRSHRDPTDR